MARVDLADTKPTGISSDGTNLTDITGTIIVTGSDNGFQIKPAQGDILLLNNVTAGAAIVTLISPPTGIVLLGGSITDAVINIAIGKLHVITIVGSLIQTDGNLYLDCDALIEVTLLRMGAQA